MTEPEHIAYLEAELLRERTEKSRLIGLLERALGARPEGVKLPPVEPVPEEPHLYVSDGVDLPPINIRLLTPEERAAKAVEMAKRDAEWRAGEAERRSRINGKPHVYFIQQGDSGAVKIGCSKSPAQRLAGLQTGHSEKLHLLACAVGSQGKERDLHERFAHLRLSGEWFRPGEDLMTYIRLVADRRAL